MTSPLVEKEKALMAMPVEVPGRIVESVYIPARAYLRARVVKAGHVMRIVDVEGQQVPDVMFYAADNIKDRLSLSNTRMVEYTWKLGKGHALYSKNCRKMATIVEDTVGMHFWGGGFCSAEANQARYGIEGTVNCRDNLATALSEYGLTRDDMEADCCFAPFMNMDYKPDGRFVIEEPISKPGDYIEFRAEMDLIVAISNCPSERNPCNAFRPTPLRFIVYEPADRL